MVAEMFKTDINKFNQTAREWTQMYANVDKQRQEKIKKIVEMGFTESQAVTALDKFSGDEN